MSEIKIPTGLDKIFDLLRKKGVKSFKMSGTDQIEVELFDEVPLSPYKRKKLEASPDKPEQPMTEEDWLLWSTDVSSEEVTHG